MCGCDGGTGTYVFEFELLTVKHTDKKLVLAKAETKDKESARQLCQVSLYVYRHSLWPQSMFKFTANLSLPVSPFLPISLSFSSLPTLFFCFFWIICCRCHKSSLCLFVARNRHADRQRGRQKDKQAHEEWKTILYEDTEKQTEVRGLRGPDWDGSEQKSIRDTLFLECNPSGLLLA